MKPKYKERKQAIELRSNGYSLNEIRNMLRISKSSASTWTKKIRLTPKQKLRLKEKEIQAGTNTSLKRQEFWKNYRVTHPKPKRIPKPTRFVETFFDHWSSNMAYVLGYFAADGSMYKNKNGSCYIAFTSTDKELIRTVQDILHLKNKIEIYQPKGNTKLRYTIQIGSKKIYKKFLEFGFTPNKSLNLNFPKIADNLIGDFLRGYFDGDGCAYFKLIFRRNRRKPYPFFQLSFRCGSKKFLISIKRTLSRLIFTEGNIYFHSGAYTLSYTPKDVVKSYHLMYPTGSVSHLQRKRQVLELGIKFWDRISMVR